MLSQQLEDCIRDLIFSQPQLVMWHVINGSIFLRWLFQVRNYTDAVPKVKAAPKEKLFSLKERQIYMKQKETTGQHLIMYPLNRP